MAYTNVISLAEAKNYLRIDSGFTVDDNAITAMINSALSFVEKRTNHIMFARDKDYLFLDGCVRVYDFPINTLVSPTGADATQKPTYTIYETDNIENETLTLNVGYSDSANVPPELIEFAYAIIDVYYYKKEGANGEIPKWIVQGLDQHRRFIF